MTFLSRLAAAAIAAALTLSAGAASAATLGTDLTGFVAGDANVRYRAQNSGDELFVGINDLGNGANRTAAALTYGNPSAFSVSYDKLTGIVTGTYGNISRSFAAAAGSIFDAIRIDVRGPGSTGTFFSLTNLSVNGTSIANISGPTLGSTVTISRLISDITPADLITLSGTLGYFGPSSNTSAEGTRVSVAFGNGPEPSVVPLPAAGWMLLAGLGGLMALRRRT